MKTMSKKIKKKKPKRPRNIEILQMTLHCKGGPMKDRRQRRAKDSKNSWRNEEDINET